MVWCVCWCVCWCVEGHEKVRQTFFPRLRSSGKEKKFCRIFWCVCVGVCWCVCVLWCVVCCVLDFFCGAHKLEEPGRCRLEGGVNQKLKDLGGVGCKNQCNAARVSTSIYIYPPGRKKQDGNQGWFFGRYGTTDLATCRHALGSESKRKVGSL